MITAAPSFPDKSRLVLLLSVAVVATLLALAWVCWTDIVDSRFVSETLPAISRTERLKGQLLLIDESTTMSARMSAATGDPQWEMRYRHSAAQFDVALAEVLRLSPTAANAQAATRLEATYAKMVAIENRAFDLTRQERRTEALQTLSSDAYETLKESFANDMADLDRLLEQDVASIQREGRAQMSWDLGTSAILIPGLGTLWWFVLRATRRWQAALVQSNAQLNRQAVELQTSARQLDEKVMERTKQLTESELAMLNMMEDAVRSREKVELGYEELKREVLERKKMEEQFRQAQKMEAIGTLAGGIAHDFNNILAVIGGYTELLKISLGHDPETRESLDAVGLAATRATHLVRQILTFSRQEQTRLQPIELAPVIQEAAKFLRATIPTTIEIQCAFTADAPVVLADTTQIHQILMNLGTNSWHAMKDRAGRLEIKLERFEVDQTLAELKPELHAGCYARISVSDTGKGMDPATVERIFEPFFTTKPVGEGTGLGLAVVHGIMHGHGGTITVSSQPGQGTVFHLFFPAHAKAVAPEEAAPEKTPLGRGQRILYVDDELPLVLLGKKLLQHLGYAVEPHTDVAVALALVRAEPSRFDLVVTDQTMPGMTGVRFARELAQIRPDLPVILTTGYAGQILPDHLQESGIREILIKPPKIHALGSVVHRLLTAQPSDKS